ncbi:hypothetical protein ABK040_002986 [Willaertia magna]
MFSFGRQFFSPSSNPQDLQVQGRTNYYSNHTSSFLPTTSNNESVPINENPPLHIKIKNWFKYIPIFTNIIFCICTIVYMIQGTFDVPKSNQICYSYVDITKKQEVWKFFTFPFFHGNILHILFNMLALYQFGNQIESTLGTIYFACLTFLFLLISPAIWLAIDAILVDALGSPRALGFIMNSCTVGYSGVLFAYLVLTVQYRPLYEKWYPNANYSDCAPKLIPWLALVITSFIMPNVSFMGHLTGMLSAYVVWLLIVYIPLFNRVFIGIDRRIPKIIKDRSFYFVANEDAIERRSFSSNNNDASNSDSNITVDNNTNSGSNGGIINSLRNGWNSFTNTIKRCFGRSDNSTYSQLDNTSGDETTNNNAPHNWGSGRVLGNA